MLQKEMHVLSVCGWRTLVFWVVGAWVGVAGAAPALATAEAPVWGLIVGLRPAQPAADAPSGRREGTASLQQQWQQQRLGRERANRVAQEAGLAIHSTAGAGRDQLLRWAQPLRGAALQDALRRARLHPEVAWVEPNVLLHRMQSTQGTAPNDPLYPLQWALQPPLTGGLAALNLPPAWDLSTGQAGTTVAVLDSGILPHPDLAGRVLPGHDFVSEVEFAGDGNGRDTDPTDPGDWVTRTGNDPAVQQLVSAGLCGNFSGDAQLEPSSWHGTFIAGQIAAATHNASGIAGVTWAGSVLPVRISGKCGAFLSDLLDGMRWAAGLAVEGAPANPHPARVINLSFGGDASCSRNPAYQSTIDEVTARGALVVVAAGNTGSQLTRPADCQGVLAVGAVRRDGLKTDYSSYGPSLSLMAPGGSTESGETNLILSASNSGETTAVPNDPFFNRQQGTSFAAPWASGVAALMLSLNSALSPAQLMERMRSGTRPWPDPAAGGAYPACSNNWAFQGICACTAATCGAGLLDAARAMQLALGPAAVITPPAPVVAGAALVLDATPSLALAGSRIVAYQWAQLAGSPVVLEGADTAVARVARLPAAGTYSFQLTVTDDQNRSGRDTVQVLVAAAAPPSGGGGALGFIWGLGLWVWVAGLVLCQPGLGRAGGGRRPRV